MNIIITLLDSYVRFSTPFHLSRCAQTYKASSSKHTSLLITSLVLAATAMFSKENGATVLGLFVVYDIIILLRQFRNG